MNMQGSAAKVNLYGGRERRDAQRRRLQGREVSDKQLRAEVERGAAYFWGAKPWRCRPDIRSQYSQKAPAQ